jgi:hypothetical protein
MQNTLLIVPMGLYFTQKGGHFTIPQPLLAPSVEGKKKLTLVISQPVKTKCRPSFAHTNASLS